MLKFEMMNDSMLKVSEIPTNWFDKDGSAFGYIVVNHGNSHNTLEIIDCDEVETDPEEGIAYFNIKDSSRIVVRDGIGQIEQYWSYQDEMVSRAAAAMGRKGGSAKSERKAKASAENGKLGGRPRKGESK